jgi:hypothetical protein
VTASVRAASKLRIAALRLDKARRSYRSSAASSELFCLKMIASFSSLSGGMGLNISLILWTSIGGPRKRAPKTRCKSRSRCLWTCRGRKLGSIKELCNQKSTTAPHAVEIKLGFRDPPRPFRGLSVRVGAGDPARHRLDLRREQRVRENWNIQAMSERVLRRASLSRRSLGPGARFRVGAIGALLAVAGQGGAAPPTSPVLTSRNSAS